MHGYSGCGWHHSSFSLGTGQVVYRWRVNQILDRSDLGLRLADEGEDAGRLVAATDPARSELVAAMAKRTDPGTGDLVRHAIALYRGRDASEHHKRSATVTLAGVLEERRSLLKAELVSKDEGALFQIANQFAIRHRRDDQRPDYDPAFLDWVFWWYLATIELTDRILDRQQLCALRPGHEPLSEQRLAIGGRNTPAPAQRPGRRAGLERGLDSRSDELRGLRVDDDVPAEQNAADDLPGVRERVVRADGSGLGHTRDCRRNRPGPVAGIRQSRCGSA
jgi:hypothetical protein